LIGPAHPISFSRLASHFTWSAAGTFAWACTPWVTICEHTMQTTRGADDTGQVQGLLGETPASTGGRLSRGAQFFKGGPRLRHRGGRRQRRQPTCSQTLRQRPHQHKSLGTCREHTKEGSGCVFKGLTSTLVRCRRLAASWPTNARNGPKGRRARA